MKVLHVIPSVGPLRGGPSFVIRTMSEGLAAHGCDVDVVTTDDNAAGKLDVPLGRPGQPADFVGTALWLASRASEWVTGALIRVDGGHYRQTS